MDAVLLQFHLAAVWFSVPANLLCAAAVCTFSCYLSRSARPLVGCVILFALYSAICMTRWRPEGSPVPTAPASHNSQSFFV
jgi:hypothetical protein